MAQQIGDSFRSSIVEDSGGESDHSIDSTFDFMDYEPNFMDYDYHYKSRFLDHHSDFTPEEELILNCTARIAGTFSLLGGAYIAYWSWKRRDHVYHRIMLAMSFYILMWSPWIIYGVAAMPVETPDVIGAYGTIGTCTTQGIFNQLSTAIPTYYVALSGFSWIVVVYGNFDPQKYAWIEKYIHIGVNLWAIGSASLLAAIEAFNPSEGWQSCYIGAVPMGCGDKSGTPCTRGPQYIDQILAVFVGLPVLVIMLVPTVVMAALACYLHCRNRNDTSEEGNVITVKAVTKQSAVYLGTLYFIYTPGLIMSSMGNFFGEEKNIYLSCFGTVISVSLGLWFAIAYRYFSAPSVSGGNGIIGGSARRRGSKMLKPRNSLWGSCSKPFSIAEKSEHPSLPGMVPCERPSTSDTSVMQDETPTELCFSEATPSTTNDVKDCQNDKHPSSEFRKSFSFNIFDGTAPSQSQWAEFIYEGDESDEEADLEETRYWAGCQQTA